MKKLLLLAISVIIMCSCTTTQQVLTKERFDNCVASVNQTIQDDGYMVTGSKRVIETSHSDAITMPIPYVGYMTTFDTDSKFMDTYKFKNSDGDEVMYTISYSPYIWKDIVCIKNNAVCEYETGKPSDYQKYLPDVSQISNIPNQSITVKDTGKTVSGVLFTGTAIGLVVWFVMHGK